MQISREKVESLANPFIVLECPVHELGPLVLDTGERRARVARIIRGNRSRLKRDFFDEVSAAFQFPPYFGENWAAFEECMNDLEDWLPATGYLLVITTAEQLLSKESSEEFEVLIRILKRTADAWRAGLNHARYLRATGESGSAEEIRFTIVFQYSPEAGLHGNLGIWLETANIPSIKSGIA